MNKAIHPVPNTQAEWQARVRSFCLVCCGRSGIAVRECAKTDCHWWSARLAPVLLTFFDRGFRDIYYQNVKPCIAALHGEFTATDVAVEYERRYNGDSGPVHPNWIGNAIKMYREELGLQYVCHKRSTGPKRKGGAVAVWRRT